MFKIKTVSLAVITTLVLGGCSSTHTKRYEEKQNENTKKATVEFESQRNEFNRKRNQIGHVIDDRPYVNHRNMYIEKTKATNYPLNFRKEIIYSRDKDVGLTEFVSEIYKNTGFIVEFVVDSGESVSTSPLQGMAADSAGQIMLPFAINNNANNNNDSSKKMQIKAFNFRGSFQEFLDYVSILNDMKWRYDEKSGKVFFFEMAIRTFYVYEQNVDVQATNNISTSVSGAGGEGGSASNRQSIQFSTRESAWNDIEKTVDTLLSSKGKVSYNRRQGKIVVEDNDYVLSKIEDYISKVNAQATRKVTGRINVLNVKLNDANSMGLNINYLNNALESNLLGNFAGNLSLGPALSRANFGNNIMGVSTESGFSALFGFLNTIGTARVNASADFNTLNNNATSFQVTANEKYIETIKRDVNGNNGNENFSIETGELKDGITMTVTPRIVGEQVMVDFSLSLSSNDGFAPSPIAEVQLPKTSNKNFNQTVLSNNGQTRILMAYKKENTQTSTQAPGFANLWFLGGNQSFDNNTEIVLITSTVYFDVN